MSADRIEKKIYLHVSQGQAWRALAHEKEFGSWFGAKFDEAFAPGASLRGVIVPTTVDAEVAKMQEPYRNTPFEITIEDMVPERLFSFRWHPYAVELGANYSEEPTTLVAFTLEPAQNSVLLTVTESGFDQLPAARREKALSANEQGWSKQMQLIERYLTQTSGAAA